MEKQKTPDYISIVRKIQAIHQELEKDSMDQADLQVLEYLSKEIGIMDEELKIKLNQVKEKRCEMGFHQFGDWHDTLEGSDSYSMSLDQVAIQLGVSRRDASTLLDRIPDLCKELNYDSWNLDYPLVGEAPISCITFHRFNEERVCDFCKAREVRRKTGTEKGK